MAIRWIIVAALWGVPVLSLVMCPYDLHGYDRCSDLSLALRMFAFYYTLPALYLAGAIIQVLWRIWPEGVRSGPLSVAAWGLPLAAWMVFLSIVVLYAPSWARLMSRRAPADDTDKR